MTKCMVKIILSVESSYNKYIEDVVSDKIAIMMMNIMHLHNSPFKLPLYS